MNIGHAAESLSSLFLGREVWASAFGLHWCVFRSAKIAGDIQPAFRGYRSGPAFIGCANPPTKPANANELPCAMRYRLKYQGAEQ
jgi:hypothetical protein